MCNLISIRIIVTYLVLVLLAGCGATLKTERLPFTSVKDVKGLAVNQSVPHEVYVIFPELPDSKIKLITLKTREFLTSSAELYTINYRGALFTSRQLEVDLHGDSSVKRVKVNSTQQLPEALESLAGAAKSAGDVQKKLTPPDPLVNENTSIELQLRNLMLQANFNAIEQGIAPPYPGIGVPAP